MHISVTFLAMALFAGSVFTVMAPVSARAAETETKKMAIATFAGGCFWCLESDFDSVDGVMETISGYTGGHKDNPSYKEVSSGSTGHKESLEVRYDPSKVSFATLLDVFWKNIDPLDANGQFCDKGEQYQSAIFYHTEEEKKLAEASKNALSASGKLKGPIVTQILPASTFWPAEDYHQNYYLKNPVRYKFYRYNCGRDKRLESIWGKK